mgnify:CR=1 FL=1
MKIKTSADYMSSLQAIKPVIYYKGEKIEDVTVHPATAPHVRAAAMTYWDYEEAVNRFQRTLETLGITEALREAGAKKGDTVFIGEYELEWSE